jgi:hypothetical protein
MIAEFPESRFEQFVQPARNSILVANAIRSSASGTAHDSIVAVDHRKPVVQRLRIFSLNSRIRSAVRLVVQLPIQPAVLERGGRLRPRPPERHILAAEAARCWPLPSAMTASAFLRHARRCVMDADRRRSPPHDAALRQPGAAAEV